MIFVSWCRQLLASVQTTGETPSNLTVPQRTAITELEKIFRAALDRERGVAAEHGADPFFSTIQGRNISTDERAAVRYAERLAIEPTNIEVDDPASHVARVLADLEIIKKKYRHSEEDPEGFGIGTLHSISRMLETYAKGSC